MGQEEDDLEKTTGGGFKRPEPEEKKNGKVKKFFKAVGKKTGEGAKATGSFISKKTGEVIASAKEASAKAKQERAERKYFEDETKEITTKVAREKKREQAIETAIVREEQRGKAERQRIKTKPTGGGLGGFFGGSALSSLPGLSGSFLGGNEMKINTSAMDSIGSGKGIDFGGNVTSVFSRIGGTPQRVSTKRTSPKKILKKFRTIKRTRRIKIKSGKRKGKFRTMTIRKRVQVKRRIMRQPTQPKAFDPFSQF